MIFPIKYVENLYKKIGIHIISKNKNKNKK